MTETTSNVETHPPSFAKRRPGLLALIIIGTAIIGFGITLALPGGTLDDRGKSGEARLACQDFVRDMLKAPATADFSGPLNTVVMRDGDDEYIVNGTVDAENSFGAKLRSTYHCELAYRNNAWTGERIVVE